MGCPPIMSQDTQDTWKFWGKTSSRFDPGVNLLIIGQLNPKRPKQEHIYIIHYISPCLCFCSILILILVGGLEHIYIIYINSIWPTNGMLFFSTKIGSTTNQLYFFTSWLRGSQEFQALVFRTLQDRPGWSRTDVDLGEPLKRSMDERHAIGFAAAATWWSERTFIGHWLGILPMGSCYIYNL